MPEVGGAGREHPRVIIKEAEPRGRPYRGGESDRLRQREGDDATGQSDAQRALLLPGADIGADQRNERCAEAKHQWHEEEFEAVARAIAGDRLGSRRDANQSRRQQHRQAGLKCADRGDRADPQDVGKGGPAQACPAEMRDTTPGRDVPAERQRRHRRGRDDRCASAGDAERRDWPEPEDQERR